MARRRRWWKDNRLSKEERAEKRRQRFEKVRRGIYVLPTLVTLANFACGFLSILFSIEGNFLLAAHFILFSVVADGLDGAIARATHTDSKFGQQLDSLADVVSFGCAPAVLLFQRFGLSDHPYWIFPLFYASAGALRLARFNAIDIVSENPNRDFRGTPIPAPACLIAILVKALETHNIVIGQKRFVIAGIFLVSYLMLSNIRYPSSKFLLNPHRPHPWRVLVLVILVIVLLFFRFTETLLILGTLYYLSGPALGMKNALQRRRVPSSAGGGAASERSE